MKLHNLYRNIASKEIKTIIEQLVIYKTINQEFGL